MKTLLHHQIHTADPDANWLVLIHGLFGDLDNLSVVRRHFQSHYNILSVDLPDHGKSPRTSGFNLEDCASALLNTLDDNGIEKACLLGHSLGGKVAMLTALKAPQKVSQLIVADIAPVSYPPRHQAVFAGLEAVDLSSLTSRKQADSLMAEHIGEPGVRQFLLKSLYQDDHKQWHWRFNLAGLKQHYDQVTDWPEYPGQYTGPVLFIKGGESDYISSEHREAIAGYFPNARAHIIEGTGHWLHAEKPQLFNQVVEKQLNRI